MLALLRFAICSADNLVSNRRLGTCLNNLHVHIKSERLHRCYASASSHNFRSENSVPRELEHRRFLNNLDKENKLSDLLKPEYQSKLTEMGIPRKSLEDVLLNPSLNGQKIDAVKGLLFTDKFPTGKATSVAEQKAAEQFIPSGKLDRERNYIRNRNTSAEPNSLMGSRDSNQKPRENAVSSAHKEILEISSSYSSSFNTKQSSASDSSIRNLLDQYNIKLPSYSPGTYRMICPKCNGGSSGELSFSVTIDDTGKSAVWHCFRGSCEYAGAAHLDKPQMPVNPEGYFVPSRKRKTEPPVRPNVKLEPLTNDMKHFFENRAISEHTLQRNRISSQLTYDPKLKKEDRIITFPYYRDNSLVNVKYRTMDKRFWQVKGAEKILYGVDDIVGSSEVVIVEGEMDKLSFEEAGIRNVVSVPDGAPSRVKDGSLPPESEDVKYAYLWNCRAWLDPAVRIVIATDNDAPGDALAEELARRLGRERCWRVRWPFTKVDHEFVSDAAGLSMPQVSEENEKLELEADSPVVDPNWYRKDANEVLVKDGPNKLRAFYENAEPLPIRGLIRFHEYYDEIIKHYFLELRDGQGVSTGWPALDKYYRVVPGELTIVTGVPNSGKSEWIDALLCNLSELHGWTFALCSMEKRATDHMRQLSEKYIGLPFFDLPYGAGIRRMTQKNLDTAIDWVDSRFHLIRYEDDALPNIDWVLNVAKAAVYRYGIRGLVVDPYNELDHQRPASMSETEYVSQMLTKIKRFAQTAGVHVWFVAHPRQLRDWKGQAPNLYDISGSAHFINKADNGVVVHRLKDPSSPKNEVEILVRKVRNKAAGTIGDCVLEYERINGRYLDFEDRNPPQTSAPIRRKLEKTISYENGVEKRVTAADLPREPPSSRTGSVPPTKDGMDSIDLSAGATWIHPDGTVSKEPFDTL